jgi:hypothetical protein
MIEYVELLIVLSFGLIAINKLDKIRIKIMMEL